RAIAARPPQQLTKRCGRRARSPALAYPAGGKPRPNALAASLLTMSALYQRIDEGTQRLGNARPCVRWVTGAGPGEPCTAGVDPRSPGLPGPVASSSAAPTSAPTALGRPSRSGCLSPPGVG